MERESVAVVRANGWERQAVDRAVAKALAHIGGIERFLKPGQSVMVKPNYTGNLPESSGGVTSNAVLEAVLRLVREAGAGSVTILEGCGTIALGTKRIFENLGVNEVAARWEARLLDANLQEMCTVEGKHFEELDKVTMVREVFDFDLVINVPVMKTHPLVDVTCAMKNMNGLLAPWDKRHFHDVNLRRAIVDFHTVLPRYLTIVDGMTGMEGMGPAEGMPVPLGLILAGENPAAVDATAARIMGFDPDKIVYLKYARQAGIGPIEERMIEVLGEQISEVRRPFAPAEPKKAAYPGVEIYDEPSGLHCVGCRAVMSIALNRLLACGDLTAMAGMKVLLNAAPEKTIVLQEGEHLFCIGACTRAYYEANQSKQVHFILGCAPAGLTVEDAFREVYQVERRNVEMTAASL